MEGGFPILSVLVFGPVAGALALALVPAAQRAAAARRWRSP